MTTQLIFIGVGGGVGTTTVAALVAQQADLTLVAVDDSDLNAPSGFDVLRAENDLEQLVKGQWSYVLDAGHHYGAPDCDHGDDAKIIAVVRGPSYTGLRRARDLIEYLLTIGRKLDAVVVLTEPGRALGERDVAEALGVPVVTFRHDPAIARLDDAGLLAARPPRAARRLTDDLRAVLVGLPQGVGQ